MASPSMSRTCARALRSSSRSAFRTTRSTSSQRRFHAAAPLYLDFLAPSWQQSQACRTTHAHSRGYELPRTHSHNARTSHLTQKHHFSTTRQHRGPAKAILNAKQDSSGQPMTINITPRAAHRLQNIASKDSNPNTALRVSVESGGCHGFQYLMSLIDVKDIDQEEDVVFENEERIGGSEGEGDGYKAKVVMDEPSLELLNGSSVDYTMELIGSQFKVTGIPGAKSSCGCGTSFDIAA
ncbi:Iron-sulfur assembly protein 2 [Cercospora beticola]|uniref:Iron-sulfur assembly protein 2 n=2 Tax=Cercospora beticola TaxID=122368 RepID=A0A2G5I0Z5_CERBT|nr:Iron-sulfur assembly protein 2 [Cercospora beticola]PIA98440.1 Iron-sulfur assembly protein 2 [Cercospora beticola]CAK1360219.1 unnamed protein product [Cercospora beticola]